MAFDEEKRRCLAALESGTRDRSRKGGVDDAIEPLLAAINAQPAYYTTSSCAGRIDLFLEPASGKKHEGRWLFVSHEEADEEEVREAMKGVAGTRGTLWFRMEGAILHVCCRDLAAADRFLKLCKAAGWKHSGVTGTTPRVMVEATTSERIDVPIAKEGSVFVPPAFIAFLVGEANRKLGKTREKVGRLQRAF